MAGYRSEDDAEVITVSKAVYQELLDDSMLLEALRQAGVDNWDGWDYAIEIFETMKV